MEKLVESISFEAPEKPGLELTIDAGYVEEHLGELVGNDDLSRYIL